MDTAKFMMRCDTNRILKFILIIVAAVVSWMFLENTDRSMFNYISVVFAVVSITALVSFIRENKKMHAHPEYKKYKKFIADIKSLRRCMSEFKTLLSRFGSITDDEWVTTFTQVAIMKDIDDAIVLGFVFPKSRYHEDDLYSGRIGIEMNQHDKKMDRVERALLAFGLLLAHREDYVEAAKLYTHPAS